MSEPRQVSQHDVDRRINGPFGQCWAFGSSVNIIDEEVSEKILAATEDQKIYVTLDSGAVAHCANPKDLPGTIAVMQPDGTRRFVGANGQSIEHWGSAKVRLQQRDGQHTSNIFQVMDVCRPLHSVSMIADNGFHTVFTKTGAVVIPAGILDDLLAKVDHVATYPRVGGLYVAEMVAKDPGASPAPASFAGQGRSR